MKERFWLFLLNIQYQPVYNEVAHEQVVVHKVDPAHHPAPADELNTDDESLFEGDIKLTPEQRRKIDEEIEHQKTRSKRKASSKLNHRWDNNIVPYVIDDSLSST